MHQKKKKKLSCVSLLDVGLEEKGEAEVKHFSWIRASKCHMRDWMKCFTFAWNLFSEKEPIKIVRKGGTFPEISLKSDWANLCLSQLKQANQISSFLLGNTR